MMAQMLFFDVFFEKDPHLNAAESFASGFFNFIKEHIPQKKKCKELSCQKKIP